MRSNGVLAHASRKPSNGDDARVQISQRARSCVDAGADLAPSANIDLGNTNRITYRIASVSLAAPSVVMNTGAVMSIFSRRSFAGSDRTPM